MNKVNVFRVDKPSVPRFLKEVGTGPYTYFAHHTSNETYQEFKSIIIKHEPDSIYNRFGINYLSLKKTVTLPEENRPGPFEDMELRSPMINAMGRMTKDGREHFYCFDSIGQFKQWFHDPKELKFLKEHSFTLSNYLVKADSFLKGLRQSVFFKEGFLYLKTRYNLLTI